PAAERRTYLPSLAVGALHVVHQRVAAPFLENPRALHQDGLRLDEVLPAVAPEPRMDERVHADRVARTRLDAHAAIDALERVDLVAHRVLLHLRIGMLARFDVDALRRTRRRAAEARREAHRRRRAE